LTGFIVVQKGTQGPFFTILPLVKFREGSVDISPADLAPSYVLRQKMLDNGTHIFALANSFNY
jgi:hypothetical protein